MRCTVRLIVDEKEVINLLGWAIFFFIIALVAAFFGFRGVAGTAATIGKLLFFVFLVLFIISLLVGTAIIPGI